MAKTGWGKILSRHLKAASSRKNPWRASGRVLVPILRRMTDAEAAAAVAKLVKGARRGGVREIQCDTRMTPQKIRPGWGN